MRQAVNPVKVALFACLTTAAIPPTEVARGKKGVVVSAHPKASEAGVEILRAGGNAMDAAVATAYALAVVEPFSAGLGGGGFLLYFDAQSQKTSVVDYREFAPGRAHPKLYFRKGAAQPELSARGILSVAVPGMVPGLAAAQKRFGRLNTRDVLEPAIRLAQEGFLVTPRFHAASEWSLKMLQDNPAANAAFLKKGAPYPVGERLFQPDLAQTLYLLKRQGPRLFTHGQMAQAMAKESQRLGGILRLQDLQSFKARFLKPLMGQALGHTVLTMPPPSSGGTHLLQMLGMLQMTPKPPQKTGNESPTRQRHFLIEVMRRAYADRAEYMGDPRFVTVPVDGLLEPAYLRDRFRTIDFDRASLSKTTPAGKPKGRTPRARPKGAPPESKDTTHLTVIDKDGNVVSLTQTVNGPFGSGVVVPGTGILLNNEMDDFAIAPGVPNIYGLVGGKANQVEAHKIPLSSMTPTIVLKNGRVRLAVGAPGGPTIITTVLQVILGVLRDGMDVAHAVTAPRIHMQWLPDEVHVEPTALDAKAKGALEDLGHVLRTRAPWGNAMAIEVLPDNTRVGAADPRGDGAADAQ